MHTKDPVSPIQCLTSEGQRRHYGARGLKYPAHTPLHHHSHAEKLLCLARLDSD